jgi:hypothetical protein
MAGITVDEHVPFINPSIWIFVQVISHVRNSRCQFVGLKISHLVVERTNDLFCIQNSLMPRRHKAHGTDIDVKSTQYRSWQLMVDV